MKSTDSLTRRPRRQIPTVKQAIKMQVLGGGAIAIVPGRADFGPLLRRGWVETISEDDGSRYLPPVRITADGLRALADAMERYPEDLRPEIKRDAYKQLNESPQVTRLKESVETLRAERDRAGRELAQARAALSRCKLAAEGVLGA